MSLFRPFSIASSLVVAVRHQNQNGSVVSVSICNCCPSLLTSLMFRYFRFSFSLACFIFIRSFSFRCNRRRISSFLYLLSAWANRTKRTKKIRKWIIAIVFLLLCCYRCIRCLVFFFLFVVVASFVIFFFARVYLYHCILGGAWQSAEKGLCIQCMCTFSLTNKADNFGTGDVAVAVCRHFIAICHCCRWRCTIHFCFPPSSLSHCRCIRFILSTILCVYGFCHFFFLHLLLLTRTLCFTLLTHEYEMKKEKKKRNDANERTDTDTKERKE